MRYSSLEIETISISANSLIRTLIFFWIIFWVFQNSFLPAVFSEDLKNQADVTVKIRHVRMETGPQFRRWDFKRIFKEHNGIGVTFTEYEYEIISPIKAANKKGRKEIHMRLEPQGIFTRPGHLWLKADPAHYTEDSLHGIAHFIYRGRDDAGNVIEVESPFSQ